jgi:AcrR family transcriptional regulator
MASESPGSAPASVPRKRKVLPSGHPRPRYDLDRLLAVAVEVFSERGYDGTSVEHLSIASGLSKSSIYHHIDSKEDLLRLALEQAITPLRATRDEPGAQEGRAIDRLRYLIRRNVEVLCERVPYVTLLLRVHGNTETERWALRERRAFDAFVAEIVQSAVDEGDLRPGPDALTTARLIFGMINSLIEWYKPGRGPSPAELADAIENMVMDGHSAQES